MDTQTNYTSRVPIQAKSQFDLMVREILQFTQVLGRSECVYLRDFEPSIRQVQQRAVRARLGFGLATRDKTPAAYSHGNSLCETTVGEKLGRFSHSTQSLTKGSWQNLESRCLPT